MRYKFCYSFPTSSYCLITPRGVITSPLLSTSISMYIVGLRICQVLYLEQLQFVLCVASTKSQAATLSGVSSSHKPFDVAEYFLLRFNIGRVICDQHTFFLYLLSNLRSSFVTQDSAKKL